MTDKVLLNSGYKEWEVDKLFHPYASKFFQKRIKDEKGTKYFIGVNKYIIDEKESYQYELYTEKDDMYAFKCLIYGIQAPMTIEEIEEEIENIWKNNNFSYYERNDEEC